MRFEDGFEVLILSDRAIDSDHAAIPSLLGNLGSASSFIRKGLRGQVGLVVEAGDVWEVHHFACLIGIWCYRHQSLSGLIYYPGYERLPGKFKQILMQAEFKKNYIKAINDGLLKVFSKMGISTFNHTRVRRFLKLLA